jgi:exo-beta-1,3-glucanase (GH17 family)
MLKHLTLLVLLSILLLWGCAHRYETVPEASYAELLRSRLMEGLSVPREDAASNRQFTAELDGRWIGQAISYGCYREGQAPGVTGPSKEQILEDLRIIQQHWNLIRVYNADDDTQRILEVIREHDLPIRMLLGIWLENETGKPDARAANVENVLRGIELANAFPQIVIAINVGNETQVYWSWHRMASEDLIRYIRATRAYVSQPVTTADDYNFWNKPESRDMAAEVDFIVSHIYPLWNSKTLSEAIPWLDATYMEVQRTHPAKLIVLGEIGWATAYNASKKGDGEQGTLIKGDVSYAAQETFYRDLEAWTRAKQITTFWFEAFDEPWKGGGKDTGDNEIEKNWGLFHADRTPKPSFVNYLAAKGQINEH